MRPLRFSINVSVDGCCDHEAIPADAALHQHAAGLFADADAAIFGRVTYQMMESAFRSPSGVAWDASDPFAVAIDAVKKYVVSSTLATVDWNAELVRGDVSAAVLALKREPG